MSPGLPAISANLAPRRDFRDQQANGVAVLSTTLSYTGISTTPPYGISTTPPYGMSTTPSYIGMSTTPSYNGMSTTSSYKGMSAVSKEV